MELKRTPLYEVHKALGAKFTGFAGWEMPVEYSGVFEEHLAVRSSCGIFDVSHMGEIEVSGPKAFEAAQIITTNDLGKISEGQCQYTLICYPDGGTVDDCIVYRMGPARFLFCVNASNTEKVFAWMREKISGIAAVRDLSGSYAQIALQGPSSLEALKPLAAIDPDPIRYYHFVTTEVAGAEAIVSRTGYTGEDGFELYLSPDKAVGVWNSLMESGRGLGITPTGLGARDTLRLEMGYPLYGHELTERITPLEAGLKKFVSFKKDFIGKVALLKQLEGGIRKTIVGIEMLEPGIPRADYEICSGGKPAGVVTSGTLSPSLKRPVGIGYVESSLRNPCTGIEIIIRKRPVKAHVAATPFYRKTAVGVKA